MQSVDTVLRQAAEGLDAIGARWAVGGPAVAFRFKADRELHAQALAPTDGDFGPVEVIA